MENLAKAFVALQADLVPVAKSATNPFFKSKYAPLPEVMETIQPLLAKHKLAVMQPMTHLDGEPAIKTILVHESGEMIEEVSPVFLDKKSAQSHGSAITYARRYGLMSLLGLVADEDDDGHKATQAYSKPAQATQAPKADNQLSEAKKAINEALEAQGVTTIAAKKAKITSLISKSTIDTLNDAEAVMSGLEG